MEDWLVEERWATPLTSSHAQLSSRPSTGHRQPRQVTPLARRPKRRLLLVLGLALILFIAANARLFVWPPTNAPSHVDAIVALGGDPGQRRAHEAIALAEAGYASVVVMSLGGYRVPCLRAPRTIQVICFRPKPVDTRGEAEFASRLAKQRHWTSMIVVPERSQSTRARLVFKRCTSARLLIVPVQDRLIRLPFDVIYEWGALFKALVLETSC